MTIPVQGPWKINETLFGRTVCARLWLTRVTEGQEAVKLSTESERAVIIGRFNAEILETPSRQVLLQEAVSKAQDKMANSDPEIASPISGIPRPFMSADLTTPVPTGTIPQHSSTASSETVMEQPMVSPIPQTGQEDHDKRFASDLDLALRLSREEYEKHRVRN
jgi:hypothetical protein